MRNECRVIDFQNYKKHRNGVKHKVKKMLKQVKRKINKVKRNIKRKIMKFKLKRNNK